MFKINECKKQALESLKGKWKAPVLGQLIFTALELVAVTPYLIFYLNLLVNTFNESFYYSPGNVILSGIGLLFSLLLYMVFLICILPPLFMGFQNLIAKLGNNVENLSCKEIFSGFKMYGKSMGAYWWVTLWIFLWMLTIYVPFMLVNAFSVASMILSGRGAMGVGIFVLIIEFLLMIGLYWLTIYKSIRYSLIWFVLADDKSVSVTEAMDISKELTKGHTLKIFLLELSFIGWSILGILSLGIGFLWIVPYARLTYYNAYKVLRNEVYTKTEEIPAPQITE